MTRGLVWVMAMVLAFALPAMPAVAASTGDPCVCMATDDDCSPVDMAMAACQQCCLATLPAIVAVPAVSALRPIAQVAVLPMLESHPAGLDPPPPRLA